jgi:hypothetical protein
LFGWFGLFSLFSLGFIYLCCFDYFLSAEDLREKTMEDFRKKSNQVLSQSVLKEAGQLHTESRYSHSQPTSQDEDLSPEDLKDIG